MKVSCITPEAQFPPVPLKSVKPGRVVRYDDLDGVAEFYEITKISAIEMAHINLPVDKQILVNLRTGRLVIKHSSMLVHPTSCSAEAYYTEK